MKYCTERKSVMNRTGAELGGVTCGHGCAVEDYKHILCNEYAFMH